MSFFCDGSFKEVKTGVENWRDTLMVLQKKESGGGSPPPDTHLLKGHFS